MSDSDFDVPAGIDVLRVFCGPDGRHGNALGVVRDGRTYPDEASRQELARRLGFSETVFVDDPERGHVDIYTPGLRLPFAGHPLVGTAWLLDLEILELPVGEIFARQDGEFTWITARPEWAPPRKLERYASVAEVEALTGPPPGEGWLYVWAWEDEAAGRVRARAFPRRIDERGVSRSGGAGACTGGIVEDEATGAAALLLSDRLGRALNITQGRGSQILTAPAPDGTVEIGGRVRLAFRSGRSGD
ncbi:PhzF family phenazine biosynthesis protein [Streptomyces sp. BE133]|uniref:PhzF family phenazine biosynthesis protein n=1 Tax=Streptomyces sp. BE133 TaxID=3002523 RepID=UPI002E77D0E4|nr:PhzF family phenazine biosynthesis protein [Streptomyces sp. BE133]MEE1807877.1 PhzF family phenazine biosynthesis protein [Streptomyces sp. BE133]